MVVQIFPHDRIAACIHNKYALNASEQENNQCRQEDIFIVVMKTDNNIDEKQFLNKKLSFNNTIPYGPPCRNLIATRDYLHGFLQTPRSFLHPLLVFVFPHAI